MRWSDLDQVMLIEHASYLTPWSRGSFEREISENSTATYVVAEQDDQICGYAGMWVLLDEGHVTNIAVHPEHRRRGLGTALLRELARRAGSLGVLHLTLEVRPSNQGAQRLYEGLGFVARGRRKRYYSDTGEDAIIMWLDDLGPLARGEVPRAGQSAPTACLP
jgi:ribosomal-protein-alanine N-acetyltransferase